LEDLVIELLLSVLLFPKLGFQLSNPVVLVEVRVFSLLGHVPGFADHSLQLVSEGVGLVLPPPLLFFESVLLLCQLARFSLVPHLDGPLELVVCPLSNVQLILQVLDLIELFLGGGLAGGSSGGFGVGVDESGLQIVLFPLEPV
jgi:hypothetical protein